jgi:hypothetical protein
MAKGSGAGYTNDYAFGVAEGGGDTYGHGFGWGYGSGDGFGFGGGSGSGSASGCDSGSGDGDGTGTGASAGCYADYGSGVGACDGNPNGLGYGSGFGDAKDQYGACVVMNMAAAESSRSAEWLWAFVSRRRLLTDAATGQNEK